MKLRISGNSLRLRVSRSEFARFQAGERLEEVIHFGAAPEARLAYVLEAGEGDGVRVRYQDCEVSVMLSRDQVRAWGEESRVGIYASVDIGAGMLEVILEKDFACLDRSDADNGDTFANPHAGSVC